MNDPFGLEREERIVRSNVRQVFTPHTPIKSVDLFLGRLDEVKSLIENLSTPGQHALLFGDRGVGKSSLANITCDLVLKKIIVGKFYEKRCDSTDTFRTILAGPLQDVGVDVEQLELSSKKTEGGNASIGIPVLKAGINTVTEKGGTSSGGRVKASSPGWVAERLKKLSGLMLIDEADALNDVRDRHLLAELVKQLSDAGSPFKLLIVGIAETASQLTDGHRSVQRCLRETRLSKMRNKELAQIVVNGEKSLSVKFEPLAVDKIVKLSSGYAHFTHLLALKAAEDAIAEGRSIISPANVEHSTRRAVNDAEGSLKSHYYDATRSSATEEYRNILCAAALCGSDEFTADTLRATYKKIYSRSITQQFLNNYLRKLVSDSDQSILRRIAKGVYKFNDPRMPSFIRIANIAEMPDAD